MTAPAGYEGQIDSILDELYFNRKKNKNREDTFSEATQKLTALMVAVRKEELLNLIDGYKWNQSIKIWEIKDRIADLRASDSLLSEEIGRTHE